MARPRKSETARAVHSWLRADRGRASEFVCPCGERAREWAYQYTSTDEKADERGYKFSLDLGDYLPMCVSCHRKMDHQKDPEQHRRKTEGARQRMIEMNKDPQYHDSRVANSRVNGRKAIATMRAAGTLEEFTRKGGKARQSF